jgi:hypothetical protein
MWAQPYGAVVLSLLSLSIETALHVRAVEQARVIVRIDGVDVSHAADHDGPDPWHALLPVNRFVATADFTTATIACCPSCGRDCRAIEARVRRVGDVVRWDLDDRRGVRGVGERRTILFDAATYDAEGFLSGQAARRERATAGHGCPVHRGRGRSQPVERYARTVGRVVPTFIAVISAR